MHRKILNLPPRGRGLHDISAEIMEVVRSAGLGTGLCHVFVQHTSASILVQENADPDVLLDLADWFARAVPDGDPRYRHTDEGPDDMPAHIRSALSATSILLPVEAGELALGRWQGIFLFEHRSHPRPRRLVLTVWG